MRYTAKQGIHHTWRDAMPGFLSHIRWQNWLPVAVGTIVVGWLALIIMGLHQFGPTIFTPQRPAGQGQQGQSVQAANTAAVQHETDSVTPATTKSTASRSLVNRSGSSVPKATTTNTSHSTTAAITPVTNINATTSSTKSSDSTQATAETPLTEVEATAGSGSDTATSSSTTDNDSSVGVSVDTPLTPPLTANIDTDNLLSPTTQVDIGL